LIVRPAIVALKRFVVISVIYKPSLSGTREATRQMYSLNSICSGYIRQKYDQVQKSDPKAAHHAKVMTRPQNNQTH
jgi:ABC-type phosphate transport system substrate-binding protein